MVRLADKPQTIAAVATPPGKGGVGIVRISGGRIESVCNAVLGFIPRARTAVYVPFLDGTGDEIDRGVAIVYPAPHSYTGESVLELQGHGGPVVMDLILQRVLSLDVRPARPGEFTERAFLNGKIDLAQAEAVSDLIDASTRQAVRSARNAIRGIFSEKINDLVEELIELRLYVEASIDFVDEDIDFLSGASVVKRLDHISERIKEMVHGAEQGCLLRDGMSVVIAGKPNSGKSSLLNLLAERDAAIVTEQAGTTRDVLRESVSIDGLPLHIIDTAGLRESNDPVELEGIRRAREEIRSADRILWMIDHSNQDSEESLQSWFPDDIPVTRVYNKIDLTATAASISEEESGCAIYLSVRNRDGVENLYRHLKNCVGYEATGDVFLARRRHLDALLASGKAVQAAMGLSEGAGNPELIAEELRLAQQSLNEITGEFTTDDLLGRIFSGFCIGK